MRWLVVINQEGIQCQVPVGKDPGKIAREIKGLTKRAKIMFMMEKGIPDIEKADWEVRETYKKYITKLSDEIQAKHGAASGGTIFGYDIRKKVAMGNGIEVLADLDAKDYTEFSKKYGGVQGPSEILGRAEKIMSGSYDRQDPAKTVSKLMRQLEIAAED